MGGGKKQKSSQPSAEAVAAQQKAYNDQQQQLQMQMEQQRQQQQVALDKLKSDQEAALNAQNTALKAKEEELARQKQEAYLDNQRSVRDTLYSSRVSAEQTAVDYVNEQIKQEMSNAAIFGMEYKLTDEEKAKRISDYFSGIWSQNDDEKLNGLFNEVGKPNNFSGFTVNRSSSASVATDPVKNENVIATSKGQKPKAKVVNELDGLLSSGDTLDSLLGG